MAAEKRKGVGNLHAHHLIGDYIPAKIFHQQVSGTSKFFSNKKFVKYVIGCPPLRPLIRIFLGRQECKFLMLLRTDKVGKTRKIHLEEMKKAGIDYSVVLLLDYLFAAKLTPEECLPSSRQPILATFSPQEILALYEKQIAETSSSIAQDPFRFFLFHCFDPRRENACQMLEKAYDSYGIVGIKLYPALGFHPIPEKNTMFYCANDFLLNPNQPEEERVQRLKNNLAAMYEFAGKNRLPIISHCGPGGSFLTLLDDKKIKKEVLWEFSQPHNYKEIVEKYNVRVCLAHMGGKVRLDNGDKQKAEEWRAKIINNIKEEHNRNGSYGRIYTDLSFDLSRVLKDEKNLSLYIKDTKDYLDEDILGKYVLFGSDWPMGLHVYPEKDYLRPYREGLSPGHQQQFFQDNTARFLFGESKKIPANYITFLEKQRKGKALKIPAWVYRKDGDYFLV